MKTRIADLRSLLAIALLVFAGRAVAWQEDDGPIIEHVAVALDGQIKTGYWNRVLIRAAGGTRDFQGTLAITATDGDGLPVKHVWSEPNSLVIPAKSPFEIERFIKLGRPTRRIRVELISAGRSGDSRSLVVDLPAPLRSNRELIASLGPTLGPEDALARWGSVTHAPVAFCTLSDATNLPASWLGYDPIDTLIVTTSDADLLGKVTDKQWSALRDWVHLGGQLILCVGARGAEILASGSPLAAFVPGELDQVVTLRNASPLEAYSGDPSRKALPDRIPMTVLKNVRGRVDLFDLTPSGQRPMMIRAPLGMGRVVFVAFDLDQSPFVEWQGRARLVERLLRESAGRTEAVEKIGLATQNVQYGYNDISGQLRSAMDQFPGVALVPFSWVAGLLLLYVLLIGPADYFLLHDVFKRMQWTWLTFPLFACLFTAVAVGMNVRFRQGEVRINHVDLIDVDQASNVVRGTTWTHLYSPSSSLYDLRIQPTDTHLPGFSLDGCLPSWQGLPGESLGGLDLESVTSPGTQPYEIRFADQITSLVDVPLPTVSTKSFVTRWWGTAQLTDRASLQVDADGLLRGELVNPLTVELSDCTVYFDNWVYRLDSQRGILAPGQRTRIENERELNLQWRLSGRRVIDSKDITTPWDQNTLDVSKILEMMMLHGAAGGEAYTHLTNRYQDFLDLSDHLRSGRAVLLGRAKSPATQLSVDGEQHQGPTIEHWTYCRIVFPVEKQRD